MNLTNAIGHLKRIVFYKYRFASIGKRTLIIHPLKIEKPKTISIGEKTYIGSFAWLMGTDERDISLRIGNDVQIGHFSHIVAKKSVNIEDGVLIADRVFISDCTHEYNNINSNIKDLPIRKLNSVHIGAGSWLGENVCVCGASIGKHCIIGANSVVTKDIPDFCVAAGIPAEVIKTYDHTMKEWIYIK